MRHYIYLWCLLSQNIKNYNELGLAISKISPFVCALFVTFSIINVYYMSGTYVPEVKQN